MTRDRREVWLMESTHDYQTLSMNRMPLAIGCIAAYAAQRVGDRIDFRLHKFVSELRERVQQGGAAPLVVGFSNYMWNCNLNLELARRIRKLYPDTVIVFGGPDFSTEEELQRRWLENNPQVDFYTQYEGEEAFTRLLEALLDAGGDLDAVKRSRPGNMVCLLDGEALRGDLLPYVDPAAAPSPYLEGLFDHYFDRLMPLLITARGCPFSCTYCADGVPYWSKVRHRDMDALGRELDYVAERVHPSHTLFLADLNFGMYKQDIEYCEKLAEIQKKRDWPWNIVVSTGKVNKQRIYDCSRLTNFAIPVNGAFQSTDPRVLGHIKRKNLGLPELKWTVDEMRRESSEAQSYSQLILALPGETIQSHLHSIGDVLQTGFDSMDIFQLMMLPSSVMSRREQRAEHGIVTRHRGLARCFGEYEWVDGERFRVIEHEEICIQNNTMSFEDYLYCRVFALTVHVFYNDFVLTPWYSLFRSEGFPIIDFLAMLHERIPGTELAGLYEGFERESREELWDDLDRLRASIHDDDVLARMRSGEIGSNLIFKYKVLAYSTRMDAVLDTAYGCLGELLADGRLTAGRDDLGQVARDMHRFHRLQAVDMLDVDQEHEADFDYDLAAVQRSETGLLDVARRPVRYRFAHSDRTRRQLSGSLDYYGRDVIGLTRLFTQTAHKVFYRRYEQVGPRGQ